MKKSPALNGSKECVKFGYGLRTCTDTEFNWKSCSATLATTQNYISNWAEINAHLWLFWNFCLDPPLQVQFFPFLMLISAHFWSHFSTTTTSVFHNLISIFASVDVRWLNALFDTKKENKRKKQKTKKEKKKCHTCTGRKNNGIQWNFALVVWAKKIMGFLSTHTDAVKLVMCTSAYLITIFNYLKIDLKIDLNSQW